MTAVTSGNVLSSIRSSLETLDAKLRDINHKIHEHPELCYNEVKAHDNIVALLRSEGLKVTPHAHGLETAFEATFGHGGRLVVFNAEYDALPEIGHACGHNLIATGSIAAFFAVVTLMKQFPNMPARVRLLGTPAEEGGGGKVKLIDAGAYENVDACLMTHPMSGVMVPTKYQHIAGVTYGTSIASSKFRATFTGKPAHAAAAPQDGINALDAAVLAYNGISMLRQQCLPSQRIHGIIVEGGDKANVIPSRATMDYNVRSETVKVNERLQERVINCFEGAALATGCTVRFEQTNSYAEVVPNRTLCSAYAQTMLEIGAPQMPFDTTCPIEESVPIPGSYSTDQGNVSYKCPSIHPVYRIPAPNNAANHTKEFTAAASTDEAYRLTLQTATGMAATAWKVLSDDKFVADVKAEFEAQMSRKSSTE